MKRGYVMLTPKQKKCVELLILGDIKQKEIAKQLKTADIDFSCVTIHIPQIPNNALHSPYKNLYTNTQTKPYLGGIP